MDSETALTSETLVQFLELLASTPLELEQLLNGLPVDELRSRSSANEFSLVENVCHLRDIEIEGYSVRIKRILMENRPSLIDIDGGRLAVERDYNRQSAKEALDKFRRARIENVRALRGIDTSQLQREGLLEGVGAVSLEKVLWFMHDHDESHLSDMLSVRRWLEADRKRDESEY